VAENQFPAAWKVGQRDEKYMHSSFPQLGKSPTVQHDAFGFSVRSIADPLYQRSQWQKQFL